MLSCILGGYLVTQKDLFLDRAQFCQLASVILAGKDNNINIDLPSPAILKVISTSVFYLLSRKPSSHDSNTVFDISLAYVDMANSSDDCKSFVINELSLLQH